MQLSVHGQSQHRESASRYRRDGYAITMPAASETRGCGRPSMTDAVRVDDHRDTFDPGNAGLPPTTQSRLVANVFGDARNGLWQVSGDIMLAARFDGIVTAINPAWTTILGWTERQIVDCSYFDLIHPDDLDRTIDAARMLLAGASFRRFDNRCRHQDGSYRWIAWTAEASDAGVQAIGRDFTAEKQQAEALLQTESELRQSQKMEAVGQLTGGLAHDFNNLLTVIAGNLELLHTRLAAGQTSQLSQYIAAAQGASKRAAALSHRLLAFSRRQTLEPIATNVNRLVDGMAELIRRAMGPGVAMDLALAPDAWATWIDQNQFENALLNLCNNARDAMPRGGRLTIGTVNMHLGADAAEAYDVPAGDYLALRFTDTGCGMTPEVMQRAFAAFFTTKRAGMGTGLGLSMIHGFVRRSGGQAWIDSAPGQGTTVWLYLPRHLGEADLPADADVPADLVGAPRTARHQTVLLVDDEPTVCDVVAEVLEELGYGAIRAADGAAGLKVLQSDTPIDLVITDIGLPGGMDGRQMAEAGRALRPGLKVLFITGYLESAVLDDINAVPHTGGAGTDVLTKPFAMKTLARRIDDLIGGP